MSCEPGSDPGPILSGEADVAEIATAYLYRSLCTISEIGAVLGFDSDASNYAATAEKVREAWRAEFVDADGSILRGSQANLVRALKFGLVDARERPQVSEQLVKRIFDDGTTVGTGFLATPFLLPVLADNGYPDLAFELLFQTKSPSWLHMTEEGATTIWENWEKVDTNGSGSLNHYSKGAVVSFLTDTLPDFARYQANLRIEGLRCGRSWGVGVQALNADCCRPTAPSRRRGSVTPTHSGCASQFLPEHMLK